MSLQKALSTRHLPLAHCRRPPQGHQQQPIFIHNIRLAVPVVLLPARQQALQAMMMLLLLPGVGSKGLIAHSFSSHLCQMRLLEAQHLQRAGMADAVCRLLCCIERVLAAGHVKWHSTVVHCLIWCCVSYSWHCRALCSIMRQHLLLWHSFASQHCVNVSVYREFICAATCRFGQQLKGNSGLASKVWDSKRDDIQQRVSFAWHCLHMSFFAFLAVDFCV